MYLYSTVTTKHCILKLTFPVKTWHVKVHLVTTPLALMTALIIFGIVEHRTFRSFVFKVYQLCQSFLQMVVFKIWHPYNAPLHNDPEISMGFRSGLFYGQSNHNSDP